MSKGVKKILKDYRLRSDREFFNIDSETIKEIFQTFEYVNTILDSKEKLNEYIKNNYSEYFSKKRKLKKMKGIYVDTSY